MKFIPAVESCLVKYLKYEGRAPRSEYWWWSLFVVLVAILLRMIDVTVLHAGMHDPLAISPLNMAWKLGTLIPGINVSTRRLHDTNRSGWWLLLVCTIIGIIPLIYWYCCKGTAGDNRFGADPLATPKSGS